MSQSNSMRNEDVALFQGVEINFAEQYHQIRRMMGTKGTDLGDLSYNTTLMYVSCPDKWMIPYSMLIEEIDMRYNMLQLQKLGLN